MAKSKSSGRSFSENQQIKHDQHKAMWESTATEGTWEDSEDYAKLMAIFDDPNSRPEYS